MAEALLDADVIIWLLRGDKATAELIKKFRLPDLTLYPFSAPIGKPRRS